MGGGERWVECYSFAEDAEHAVEGTDANLAVGPVVHGSPAQPVSVLEPAKHALHGLLDAVGSHHLLGSPIQAVGQERSSSQSPAEKLVESRLIEVELELPAALFLAQLVLNEPGQELDR